MDNRERDASRILITSLSLKPKELEYYFDHNPSQRIISNNCTLAIIKLGHHFDEVYAICTEDTVNSRFQNFKNELTKFSSQAKVTPLVISSNNDFKDLILTVIAHLPLQGELSIDLTHGFRHIPILLLTATYYLTAVTKLTLGNLYYGLISKNHPCTIYILNYVQELVQWGEAVSLFKRDINVIPLINLLKTYINRLHDDPKAKRSLENLLDAYVEVAFAVNNGLPVELLNSLKKMKNLLSKSNIDALDIFMGENLFEEIRNSLQEQFSFHEYARPKNKRNLVLTEELIKLLVEVIDFYIVSEGQLQYDNALGQMRELFITLCLYHWRPDARTQWLNKKTREQIERTIGGLSAASRDKAFNELFPNKEILSFWNQLSDLRNMVQHHGMREEEIKINDLQNKIKELWSALKQHINNPEFWNIDVPSKNRVLISPLGLTNGALYTAIKRLNPDLVIVIASTQSQSQVQTILQEAGSNANQIVKTINDPFLDFTAWNAIKTDKDIVSALMGAKKVMVNITGGTTVMQYIVERLNSYAAMLNKHPKSYAMIDRRPYDEQKTNPYVEGEILELSN